MRKLINDLHYYSGIFDVKGTILIAKRFEPSKKNPNYSYFFLQITLSSKIKEIIKFFHNTWGGSILLFKGSFIWTITGSKAERFLKEIRPYLNLQKNQCDIALQFRNRLKSNCTRNMNTDEISRELNLRENLRYAIHKENSLNNKIPNPYKPLR